MVGFPSLFGGDDERDDLFDDYDEYVPEHLPEPGPFVAAQQVLTGETHVAFHEVTRAVFEERTVYDMTFNYNLAKLNLDTRHPNAGYRYAVGSADGRSSDEAVLRAEFTPTTPFCPQSNTLTVGSFRAWNGLSEHHEYDIVRVRLHPMHHQSASINERLAELEAEYRETGTVTDAIDESAGTNTAPSTDRAAGYDPNAPF
ncbi:hypothetical protein G3I44_08730 [Halogeometricum borinquense]|uniref:DUF7998 domain-containing protein n=1 Tax=Halogeometricum borinquense TaxID=60847 RepID=A0A6C0UKJ3_9EURY|nr:hypothetical protein [Halogeometricum borinquense]QIB74359.1 hypothetical protein G3I44_08730 [Halogeometricum borinquense]